MIGNSFAVGCTVAVAFGLANLPFLTQRFAVFANLAKPKSLGLRVLELVIFYFFAGAIGLLLEQRAGQMAPQTWEFYAITACLFLTFAFPGFVYRYLLRR